MTFSIVATDGESWGVAVASKFLAVGAAVPAARAGVGAIATQSYANLTYRPDGLALLVQGKSAQETLDALTAADELREQRQAGVVDGRGGAATFSGADCHAWAGGVIGAGYAIQGNILTGPEVVEAMERAWLSTGPSEPFAGRLLAAVTAGDDAGGDRRGRQSAAIFVARADGGYGGGSDIDVDLRVDDAALPIPELARLLDLHKIFFSAPDPSTLLEISDELSEEISRLLTILGFAPTSSEFAAIRAALWDWAGVENLEERLVKEPKIDPVVLQLLRAKAADAPS